MTLLLGHHRILADMPRRFVHITVSIYWPLNPLNQELSLKYCANVEILRPCNITDIIVTVLMLEIAPGLTMLSPCCYSCGERLALLVLAGRKSREGLEIVATHHVATVETA